MKEFNVNIYYSGFCSYTVKAEDETSAIIKARQMKINENEILSTLEEWKEADTAEEV